MATLTSSFPASHNNDWMTVNNPIPHFHGEDSADSGYVSESFYNDHDPMAGSDWSDRAAGPVNGYSHDTNGYPSGHANAYPNGSEYSYASTMFNHHGHNQPFDPSFILTTTSASSASGSGSGNGGGHAMY
jgi:hypothetical protein